MRNSKKHFIRSYFFANEHINAPHLFGLISGTDMASFPNNGMVDNGFVKKLEKCV